MNVTPAVLLAAICWVLAFQGLGARQIWLFPAIMWTGNALWYWWHG